jgi:SAM-dependent methyltransferase
MSVPVPVDPRAALVASDPGRLFADVAVAYARHRADYAPEAFSELAARFGLDGSQRVLDLGAGTGKVALPLAPLVGEIVAVDPSTPMLAELVRLAAADGTTAIRTVVGDSRDLPALGLGSFDVVTMGSSFHWMDRPAVLAVLDGMVRPDGGIALLSNRREPQDWHRRTREVRERFGGTLRGGSDGGFNVSARSESHEAILRSSPFSAVVLAEFPWTAERTVEEAVEMVLTYSMNTPPVLGERVGELRHALTEALEAIAVDGRITDRIRTVLVTATRQRERPAR